MTPTVVEDAPAPVVVPTAAAHLTIALGRIDRLIRVETRRATHLQLQAVRAELMAGIAGIAHSGSDAA
jgi:hypothetical protein